MARQTSEHEEAAHREHRELKTDIEHRPRLHRDHRDDGCRQRSDPVASSARHLTRTGDSDHQQRAQRRVRKPRDHGVRRSRKQRTEHHHVTRCA